MKRALSVLALFAGLLSLVVFAQPAEATHNASFSFRAGGYGYSNFGYNTYAVRAFTFQPTFALQTYTYAAYQPFALVPVQPVAAAAEPVYAAPCPSTYQLFTAPGYGYGNFASPTPGYGYSTFQASNAGYTSFSGFRGGFHNAPSFDRFSVRVNAGVNNRFNFRANSGVNEVNVRTVERNGLFGLRRDVTNTTIRSNANGNVNVNVQTFERGRLRR